MMEIKDIIPRWVTKVLLISHAAKIYPHIREGLARLVKDEEKAKKKAIEKRIRDGNQDRGI